MATITRKSFVSAIAANDEVLNLLANDLNVSVEDVANVVNKMATTLNRPTAKKPSKDTIRNAQIKDDIVAELSARGEEFTAADLSAIVVDPDGYPMTTRKVAALLAALAREGRICKSPEKWTVAHYAMPGVEFKVKPVKVRKSKKNAEDTAEVSEN